MTAGGRIGRVASFAFLLTAALAAADVSRAAAPEKPNIVVIFIDDLGYADIGPFGATGYSTPNLDRMAAEGRRFTDFHTSSAVCSASRAALLTGCYHERVSIVGALRPNSPHGINADELTLAELCKQQGYATAIYGKWHLGDRRRFLPLQHGFDEYYGLPYSNDMWPRGHRGEELSADAGRKKEYPPLRMIEGNEVADEEVTPEDQTRLTKEYTRRAVDFIDRHREEPFFLYVPHSMVHVPLYVSKEFEGKSGAGLFGDVMMEVDWSVGQILDALRSNGLDEKTLVVFTSDNGPWLNFGNHAGSAGPLREGKGTMYEGGSRVPCVMWFPGQIPAGSECDAMCATFDLLPTVARLLGVTLPAERIIDGRDIWPLMVEADAKTPHDYLNYYYDHQLRAIRDERWKLMLPHQSRTLNGREGGRDGYPVQYDVKQVELALYDLDADVGETRNVAKKHREEVARLMAAAEAARADLGDSLTGVKGKNVRPAGVRRQREGGERQRR